MRRILSAVALAVFIITGASASVDAVGNRVGDVQVIDVGGSYGPLKGGGSATQFTLRPSVDATCPGDSQHENWRVQSFLVPATVNPASLHYLLQAPDVAGGFGLFDIYGMPVEQILLHPNDAAGQPAQMDALRPMSFGVYHPGDIPPGRYRMGLACTQWRQTYRYWDIGITITADPNDQPAGMHWTVDGAATPHRSSDNGVSWAWWSVLGVPVVVAVVILRRRRSTTLRGRANTDGAK